MTSHQDGPLSNGAKALRLLLDQKSWTHRKVESLSFLANGETRHAISWDFTLPSDLAIEVPGERVAVPIANVRKGPLKRFDLRDAGGKALPVWGARDNGALAVDLLVSGLEGLLGSPAAPSLRAAVESIVFAPPGADVSEHLELLRDAAMSVPMPAGPDVLLAFDSLAATLAESFVLVVEMPRESAGVRTLLKAAYEDERVASAPQVNLAGRVDIDINADGWGDSRSWHLEVRAPQGLRVSRLRHETWDPESLDLTTSSLDEDGTGTAHVAASDMSAYDAFSADVQFIPNRTAVLNPLSLGAFLSSSILWLTFVLRGPVVDKLDELGSSGAPLGAIAFAIPALFFALLSRGEEHELVSRVLLGVRLASLGCAVSLWAAGVLLVWSPGDAAFSAWLAIIATTSSLMLGWLLLIRNVTGSS